jgi:hypothetical protein
MIDATRRFVSSSARARLAATPRQNCCHHDTRKGFVVIVEPVYGR